MLRNKDDGKAFAITEHKGFHMRFSNGCYISVQWGPGNYCEHFMGVKWDAPRHADFWQSDTAEIACVGPNGEWLTKIIAKKLHAPINDDVDGRLSTEEVLKYMVALAKYNPKGEKK